MEIITSARAFPVGAVPAALPVVVPARPPEVTPTMANPLPVIHRRPLALIKRRAERPTTARPPCPSEQRRMTNRKTESQGAHIAYQRGDVLYVLADPASFNDDRVRLAIGVRNEATLSGVCPVCGAVNDAGMFAHERDCIAGDDHLQRLAREGAS